MSSHFTGGNEEIQDPSPKHFHINSIVLVRFDLPIYPWHMVYSKLFPCSSNHRRGREVNGTQTMGDRRRTLDWLTFNKSDLTKWTFIKSVLIVL